jgi:hypothetical protein
MGRRTQDINRGAIMALVVVAGIIGFATGSFWAFLLSGVALYFLLKWLRIIRSCRTLAANWHNEIRLTITR